MNPLKENSQTSAAGLAKPHLASEEMDIIQQRRSRLGTQIQPVKELNYGEKELTIKGVKAWIVREPVSEGTYTVIKIETGTGISGYGECAELSLSEFTEAKKIITGIPATSFEAILPMLKNCPTARAGLNIAMLDIAGKLSVVPVYQILGGPTRYKVRAFAMLKGDSDEDLLISMKKAQSSGYRAFMVPVPALKNQNQGQSYVLSTLKRLESLRSAGGENVDFILDGKNSLNPGDAQMISAAIEKFHVLWFNEPCAVSNLGTIKKLAAENVTPVGSGRFVREGGEIQDMLREDAVDIIRPDIGLNGISQIRRMAAIAEIYYVAVGPSHYGGPVGTAAAFQLAASIPNFFIQQIPFPEAEEDRRMRLELTTAPVEVLKEGFADLPVTPGLGIEVNEKSLEKYSITSF